MLVLTQWLTGAIVLQSLHKFSHPNWKGLHNAVLKVSLDISPMIRAQKWKANIQYLQIDQAANRVLELLRRVLVALHYGRKQWWEEGWRENVKTIQRLEASIAGGLSGIRRWESKIISLKECLSLCAVKSQAWWEGTALEGAMGKWKKHWAAESSLTWSTPYFWIFQTCRCQIVPFIFLSHFESGFPFTATESVLAGRLSKATWLRVRRWGEPATPCSS